MSGDDVKSADLDPAEWARELIEEVRPIAEAAHAKLYPHSGPAPVTTLAPMLAGVLLANGSLPTPTPAEERALRWLCNGEWETLAVIVGWIARAAS